MFDLRQEFRTGDYKELYTLKFGANACNICNFERIKSIFLLYFLKWDSGFYDKAFLGDLELMHCKEDVALTKCYLCIDFHITKYLSWKT